MEVFIPASGRVYLDFVFAGLETVPVPGEECFAKAFDLVAGGSYNVARALHRLGVDVHLAADLGDDAPSEILRRIWDQDGLPTTFRRRAPGRAAAVTCSYSLASDRAFVSYIDPIPPPEADPDILEVHRVGNVLLDGVPDGDDFHALLQKARDLDIPVYLDCQDSPRLRDADFMERLLSRVDTLFCNERESEALSGLKNPEEAARVLAGRVPLVIVKRGGRGAIMARGGKLTRVAAPSVSVIDTTGAGDAFVAGFLFALLRKENEESALIHGLAAGSLACTGIGGAAAPEEAALLRLIKVVMGSGA